MSTFRNDGIYCIIARNIFELIEDFGNLPKCVIVRIALVEVALIKDLPYISYFGFGCPKTST